MKILLLNQAFYPDTVSTAQHLTDLALDLKERGHEVTVLTGNHGYDDPSEKYLGHQEYRGIRIRRLGYPHFGKKFKAGRAADFAIFLLKLSLHLIFTPRQDVIVALTSPPLIVFPGILYCRLKGGKMVQWLMDLNPDEAVAAGWLKENSLTARFLRTLSSWSFHQCQRIIVLDRFMKDRLTRCYGLSEERISVIPPWAHDEAIRPVPHAENSFRQTQNLAGKFVAMYSGNHSPCHPLGTVLEAAKKLQDDPSILFYFIGGGSLVPHVKVFAERNGLKNIIQLPYQPLDQLSESLSAGDLHLAVMGSPFVGILHPCKIYGILAVGRPFVFIGPSESHLDDLMKKENLGRRVDHGDVNGLIEAIGFFRRMNPESLRELAHREITYKDREFARRVLCPGIIQAIEETAR